MWTGDNESNTGFLTLSQQLLENQRDFDIIDEQALSSTLLPGKGSFVNSSGQEYRAIIIPKISLISESALNRLKEFASKGGKVIFMGKLPEMAYGKSISTAKKTGDLSWASVELSGNITSDVLKMLPAPDLKTSEPCISLKYLHRKLKDADLYFIFNESTEAQTRVLTLSGTGRPEVWDAMTGTIASVKNESQEKNRVKLTVTLEPWETKFIIIRN
jgi:hypothetical protein